MVAPGFVHDPFPQCVVGDARSRLTKIVPETISRFVLVPDIQTITYRSV